MFVYHYIFFSTTAEGSTCKCKQALLPENTNLACCHPTSLCPSLPAGCPGAGHGACALLHTVLLTPKSLGFSLLWFSPPLSCYRILLFWSIKKKKIFKFSEQTFSCLPVSTTVIFLVSHCPGMSSAASPGSLSLCPLIFLSKQSFFPPVPAAHLPQGSQCPHQIGGSCTKGAARLAANSPALEEPWLSKAREECGVPSKSRY